MAGGRMANINCYEQFNIKGTQTGHCGPDKNGNLTRCQMKYVILVYLTIYVYVVYTCSYISKS